MFGNRILHLSGPRASTTLLNKRVYLSRAHEDEEEESAGPYLRDYAAPSPSFYSYKIKKIQKTTT